MPIDILKTSSDVVRLHQFAFFEELKRLDRERWDLESVAAAIAACGGD